MHVQATSAGIDAFVKHGMSDKLKSADLCIIARTQEPTHINDVIDSVREDRHWPGIKRAWIVSRVVKLEAYGYVRVLHEV